MKWTSVTADELIVKWGGSVNPAKFPDEIYLMLNNASNNLNLVFHF